MAKNIFFIFLLLFINIYVILIYMFLFEVLMVLILNKLTAVFQDVIAASTDVLKSFRPVDAIEILVLALFLFFAFRFLKGRKAGALIIGIIICFILLFVSTIFELNVLKAILSSIVGSGTLVIIVIFQPEIREALEKIGSGSIHGLASFSDRRKKKELYYNVIEHVCDAVAEMSKESTGALIVIERTTGLAEIIDTGIVINADVSSSLLRNLFYNRAPLHDGAVVISEGRLAAAGCFLPLTRRTDVDPNLGTRHRAALGISETSDALTIVVSEETGLISVAYDCTLRRGLSNEELKNFLNDVILRRSGNLPN